MIRELPRALRMALILTFLTGLAYPGLVTALCQRMFPAQAGGSLVRSDGRSVGSKLLAQGFMRPEYFHPRPSAAHYDAIASGGSNLGPTSRPLIERIRKDLEQFHRDNPGFSGTVPSDLLTESGSGLDPHISPASALVQVPRVAEARGIPQAELEKLVWSMVRGPQWGFLGDARVNVLLLNLALDRHFPLAP
jgi:K+-transporting ATPase ATPase C chain